jgi:hypothetical protein
MLCPRLVRRDRRGDTSIGLAVALRGTAIAASLSDWPFLRARLVLAYGSRLRREHRNVESRLRSRLARTSFDVLAIPNWSERARRELRAAGEASEPVVGEARDLLTAQELLIAKRSGTSCTSLSRFERRAVAITGRSDRTYTGSF